MPEDADPNKKADSTRAKPDPARGPKHKGVGDETPNPLPDQDYSPKQPAADDNQSNPESDSAVS